VALCAKLKDENVIGDLTPKDRENARNVHQLFSAKQHSEHVASEFALAHLAAILRTHDIGSVLEFGAGIGTITYLLLTTLSENVRVHCTERDELYLALLNQNLTRDMQSRLVVHTAADAPLKGGFDLVIIDGDISRGSAFLDRGSVCFFEGNRRKARGAIELSLNQRGLTCALRNYIPSGSEKGCWIGRVKSLQLR
jgi:predicted O-methyltransferase YrrM